MLSGKRILVTGGTTGIGRAVVHQLLNQGARVVTFGRDPAALADAMAAFEGVGEIYGLVADIAVRNDIERVFARLDPFSTTLFKIFQRVAAAIGSADAASQSTRFWRHFGARRQSRNSALRPVDPDA